MHKDLLGKPIALNDYVITNQNNRIILARIVKFTDRFVFVQPMDSDAGRRRHTPPQKMLRKYSYNIALVDAREITWATLTNSI